MYPGQGFPGGFWPGVADPVAVGAMTLPPPPSEQAARDAHVRTFLVRLTGGPRHGTLLDVVGGEVSVQDEAPFRSLSCTLTVPDGWSVRDLREALDPRGHVELQVQAVLAMESGQVTSHELGVFGVTSTSLSLDRGGRSLTLSCPDRSVRARRSLLFDGVKIEAGTTVAAAIGQVMRTRCPWLPVDVPDRGHILPETVVGEPGADPLSECQELAAAAGLGLRIDARGVLVGSTLTPAAAAHPSAVWIAEEGLLLSVERTLDGTDLVEGVIVPWGEGRRAVVPDDSRATYALFRGDTSLITTAAQATAAGFAELARTGGLLDVVSGDALADYSLDAGQAVLIGAAEADLWTKATVASLRLPLSAAPMGFSVVARRLWGWEQ